MIQEHIVETTLPPCFWHLAQAEDLASTLVVLEVVVEDGLVVVEAALLAADVLVVVDGVLVVVVDGGLVVVEVALFALFSVHFRG